eukprot:202756-Chlamydomonas_euryale.AAC.1
MLSSSQPSEDSADEGAPVPDPPAPGAYPGLHDHDGRPHLPSNVLLDSCTRGQVTEWLRSLAVHTAPDKHKATRKIWESARTHNFVPRVWTDICPHVEFSSGALRNTIRFGNKEPLEQPLWLW